MELLDRRSVYVSNNIHENGSYQKVVEKDKKIERYIFAIKHINVSAMSWDSLVRFILPDGLFDYFKMSHFKPGHSEVHIWIE